MNYNFKKDLIEGQKGEEIVSQFLQEKGFEIIHFNDDNKYDILTSYNNKEFKWEVKTDDKHQSGNLCIELSSYGRKSNIFTTEADYYVNYFLTIEQLWIIKVDKLKQLMKDIVNNDIHRIVNGGDNNQMELLLFNRYKYQSHFKVIKLK